MNTLAQMLSFMRRFQSVHAPLSDGPARRRAARIAAAAPGALGNPPFVLVHQLCGKPAFFLHHRPVPQSLLLAKDILRLDGIPSMPGRMEVCGSCGKIVGVIHSADVVENV